MTGCAAGGGAYTLEQEALDQPIEIGDEEAANDILLRRIKIALPHALARHSSVINSVSVYSDKVGKYNVHVYTDAGLADYGKGFKQKVVESLANTAFRELRNVGLLGSDGPDGKPRLKDFMITVHAGRDTQNSRLVGRYKYPEMMSQIR